MSKSEKLKTDPINESLEEIEECFTAMQQAVTQAATDPNRITCAMIAIGYNLGIAVRSFEFLKLLQEAVEEAAIGFDKE